MPEFSIQLVIDVLTIILIDLLLAGDNAVVIALAARSLPPKQQKQAILIGSGAAIVMRIGLTLVAAQLPGDDLHPRRQRSRQDLGQRAVELPQCQRLQPLGALDRAGDRAADLALHAGQRVDEFVDGGAGAHTDDLAGNNVCKSGLANEGLEFILGHGLGV